MVRLTLELDVNNDHDAEDFRQLVQDWADMHGAMGNLRVHDHHQRCPECGSPMVYDGALDAWVCHHPEDGDADPA